MWVVVLVGCGLPPSSDTRRVTGQLSAASLSRLDHPAIVVRSADGSTKVARVARTGDFALAVPVGVSTRLSVAAATPEGGLREDSTIVWPHRWAVVGAGQPIDLGVVRPRGAPSRSCDRDPGELDDNSDGDRCASGRGELPYDAKIPRGATFRLTDAFLEKGPVPAQVVSVEMEGAGAWRLAELRANTPFVVNEADCAHAGNRDEGRDRVVVTWINADGSRDSDHLDLRYCEGSVAPAAMGTGAVGRACTPPSTVVDVCDEDDGDESVVDDGPREGVQLGLSAAVADRCGPIGPPATPVVPGPGGPNATCLMNAGCAAGLACFQSRCVSPIN